MSPRRSSQGDRGFGCFGVVYLAPATEGGDLGTDTTGYVKIAVPPGEGAQHLKEDMWAEPVDLAAGVYRIDNVSFMAEVSLDDLVRCDVSRDNWLVAVEVLERSPNVTVGFRLTVSGLSREAYRARQHRLIDRIEKRYGSRVNWSMGGAFLSVCVPLELLDQLFETVLADSGPGAIAHEDGDLDVLGDWAWLITSHPEWDVPAPIHGANELLDREVDLVAVDWPADDPVASRWPTRVKDMLRDQAATSAHLRQLLDERRYTAALVPWLRVTLRQEHGMDAVGDQPFPLYPASNEDEQERFEQAWVAATEPDGRVRWCADDTVDAEFRRRMETLGLDPDADPRQPVT